MVFKRQGVAAPALSDDLKMVDELAKKSLQINPTLTGGRDVDAALQELRAVVRGDTLPGGPVSLSLVPKGHKRFEDPRQQTIAIFMGQRSESFEIDSGSLGARKDALLAEFADRMATLEREEQQHRHSVLREIAEFVRVILGSGAEGRETTQTLEHFKRFLDAVGTSSSAIVKAAQGTP